MARASMKREEIGPARLREVLRPLVAGAREERSIQAGIAAVVLALEQQREHLAKLQARAERLCAGRDGGIARELCDGLTASLDVDFEAPLRCLGRLADLTAEQLEAEAAERAKATAPETLRDALLLVGRLVNSTADRCPPAIAFRA